MKQYELAIYEKDNFGGLHYCILDKKRPNSTYRLGYHTLLVGNKACCEIVVDLLNEKNEIIKTLGIGFHIIKKAIEDEKETSALILCVEILKKLEEEGYLE